MKWFKKLELFNVTSTIFKKVLLADYRGSLVSMAQLNKQPIDKIIEEFENSELYTNIDIEYFAYLLTNIDSKFEDLKETIENTSNLSWGRIKPVEKV